MKKIFLLGLTLVSNYSFGQSLSVKICEKILSSPKIYGEQYLVDNSFQLVSAKPIDDFETLKRFSKGDEDVYVG